MKKNNIFLLLLSIVIFLMFFIDFLNAKEARGVKRNSVSMGLILDQTGPVAGIGVPYTMGVRNYFRNINDTGGINGRKIKIIVEDDRYSIPMAVAAFKKLIFKDKVLGIFFSGGTGQNTTLFGKIKRNKVPVMTGSWSWTMTDPLQKYIFSPGNDNKDEIMIMMNYLVNNMKARNARVAIVGPDVEYSKSGMLVAEAKAKELKVKIAGKEIVPVGAIEASSQMLILKRKKVTHIISLTTGGPTLAILKSAKKLVTGQYTSILFTSLAMKSHKCQATQPRMCMLFQHLLHGMMK